MALAAYRFERFHLFSPELVYLQLSWPLSHICGRLYWTVTLKSLKNWVQAPLALFIMENGGAQTLQSNGLMIGVLLGSHQNKSVWFVPFHDKLFVLFCFVWFFFIFACFLVPYTLLCAFTQRDDFWNEAIKLADLHHPNVLAFYGVVLDGPGGSVATVTEYMVNGSLRNALQKNEK